MLKYNGEKDDLNKCLWILEGCASRCEWSERKTKEILTFLVHGRPRKWLMILQLQSKTSESRGEVNEQDQMDRKPWEELTFQEIKQSLRDKFGHRPTYYLNLLNKRQTDESILEFITNMQFAGLELNLNESIVIEHTIQMLKPEYRSRLLSYKPFHRNLESISKLIKHAKAIESKFKENKTMNRTYDINQDIVCFACHQSGHIARYCRIGGYGLRHNYKPNYHKVGTSQDE